MTRHRLRLGAQVAEIECRQPKESSVGGSSQAPPVLGEDPPDTLISASKLAIDCTLSARHSGRP
jgi:hypothetical protein